MVGDVVARPMQERDVAAVAALCEQLGYPTTEETVAQRFAAVATRNDEVFVATTNGAVIGWIHLHVWVGLESGPDVEIGGLVVDERYRSAGVGRMLMALAEGWATEHGCARVRLRSNVIRAGAHAFYQRIGDRIFKTQYAFEKLLRP
jgi:GNAT superfamily N-acetyltransferase